MFEIPHSARNFERDGKIEARPRQWVEHSATFIHGVDFRTQRSFPVPQRPPDDMTTAVVDA